MVQYDDGDDSKVLPGDAVAADMPMLPGLGKLQVDASWWRYPSLDCIGGDGIARLRVWTAGDGCLAVVTELGLGVSITNAIADIWHALAPRFPGSLTLIEHWPAAEASETGEHLDLVKVHGRTPDWRRLWPTSSANPHHDAFEAWMTEHGYVILGGSSGLRT